MPYFAVLVGGEGKIKREGLFEETPSGHLKGFVTTCIFKALSAKEAESMALLKIDKRWRSHKFAGFIDDGILLNIEETIEITIWRYYSAKIINKLKLGGILSTIPEKGHSFY